MKNIFIIIFIVFLSGCGFLTMGAARGRVFEDPRWDLRLKKINLAQSLVGAHKDSVVEIFGEVRPMNINKGAAKFPRSQGDPYEIWVDSEEEWVYRYYEGGIPMINSFNYWLSFHFVDDYVVGIDY